MPELATDLIKDLCGKSLCRRRRAEASNGGQQR